MIFFCKRKFLLKILIINVLSMYQNGSIKCMDQFTHKVSKQLHTVAPAAFYSLALLSQVSSVVAYPSDFPLPPGTFCYEQCIANCTTYEPFICRVDLSLPAGIFSFLALTFGMPAIGACTGFSLDWLMEKCSKMCQNGKRSIDEHSALNVNDRMIDTDL